jgi:hypothetical protein
MAVRKQEVIPISSGGSSRRSFLFSLGPRSTYWQRHS